MSKYVKICENMQKSANLVKRGFLQFSILALKDILRMLIQKLM